jgi:hypothetical protein
MCFLFLISGRFLDKAIWAIWKYKKLTSVHCMYISYKFLLGLIESISLETVLFTITIQVKMKG